MNSSYLRNVENCFVLGYHSIALKQKYLIVTANQLIKFDQTLPPSLRGPWMDYRNIVLLLIIHATNIYSILMDSVQRPLFLLFSFGSLASFLAVDSQPINISYVSRRLGLHDFLGHGDDDGCSGGWR